MSMENKYAAWQKPKNGGGGKETYLPRVGLSGWSQKEKPHLLPELEEDKRPSLPQALGAAWQLWLTDTLTRPTTIPGTDIVVRRAWADRAQETVIKEFGGISKWMFPDQTQRVEIPLPENVNDVLAGFRKRLQSVKTFNVGKPISIAELDDLIDFRGRELMKQLYYGRIDGRYGVTADEKAAAVNIELHAGLADPQELQEMLREQVLARAVDISLKGAENHIAERQQAMDRLLLKMEKETEPQVWFVFDPVTRRLFLSRDESKAYGQTLFGFTPTSIKIARPRGRFKADIKPIPMLRISKEGKDDADILMEEVTHGPLDVLRRYAGPIIGIDIQTKYKRRVPGAIEFTNMNRDKSFGVIALRDTPEGIEQIDETAKALRGAYDMFDLMTERLHKADSPPVLPIRPQVVEAQLSDPTIMRRPTTPRRSRSQMAAEYQQAIGDLERGYEQLRDFWQSQKSHGRVKNGRITNEAHQSRWVNENQRVADALHRAQHIGRVLPGLPPIPKPGYKPQDEFV